MMFINYKNIGETVGMERWNRYVPKWGKDAITNGLRVIDCIVTVITFGTFFVMSLHDGLKPNQTNVTRYCDDPGFHVNNLTPVSNLPLYVSILITLIICFPVIYLKMKLIQKDSKQVLLKMCWHFGIILTYIVFLFVIIQIIKYATGIPSPSFYTNKDIKMFHCSSENATLMTEELEKKENKLRTSFPSYRSALLTFSLSLIYLYVDHVDFGVGIHATQQVSMIFFGYFVIHNQFQAWMVGENHLSDIVVGNIFGLLQGILASRCMFGTVFGSIEKEAESIHPANFSRSLPPLPSEFSSLSDIMEMNVIQDYSDHHYQIAPPPTPEPSPQLTPEPTLLSKMIRDKFMGTSMMSLGGRADSPIYDYISDVDDAKYHPFISRSDKYL